MKNKEHSDLVKQLKYWQAEHKRIVYEIYLLKESEWSIWENDYEYKFYQRINAQIGEFRDVFNLYGGEYGFHTISRIVEIEIKDRLI